MAPPPKFNYDSEDFTDELLALAMQGYTDDEIADALEERFGQSLDPTTFSSMKNGHYECWSEEENLRRGSAIRKALARGRRKINAIVRGRYLKAALGGLKTRNRQRITRPVTDPVTGLTQEVVIQVNESEFESAPNVQALATWLNNHDAEWRRASMGMPAAADDAPPADAGNGVDIEAWIRKETGVFGTEGQ